MGTGFGGVALTAKQQGDGGAYVNYLEAASQAGLGFRRGRQKAIIMTGTSKG